MDKTNLASKRKIRRHIEWSGNSDQARQKFQNNLMKEPSQKARRGATCRIAELVGNPDLLCRVDSVLKFWEHINTVFLKEEKEFPHSLLLSF